MASNNPYTPYQYAAAPSSGLNSAVHTPDAQQNMQNMQNNMARLQMMAAQYQQQQQQQALLAALATQTPVQLAQQRQQYMAIQQAQMDVQMRQLQMAQLALQQSQAQQQQRQQQQAFLMQQQQQLAVQALNSAQTAVRHTRAVSASPAIEQRSSQSRASDSSEPLPAPSASRLVAARELSSLQTRANRQNMISTPLSPATPASDWQAKRMSFPATTRNVSAPQQTVYAPNFTNLGSDTVKSASFNELAASSSNSSIPDHHRNTISATSANSSAFSNSVCSPNRGPALVLSGPGEEFNETDVSTDIDASIVICDANGNSAETTQAQCQSRHTVILSSQLPPAAGLAAAAKELHQRRASQSSSVSASDRDSQPSSGNSSPTSDKSDMVSFESNETGHTSLEESSPLKGSNSAGLAVEGTPRASASKSLNPSALEFPPPCGAMATPQRRPASSRLRTTSPPTSVNGAFTVAILRQPKGPADESELAMKNFAGVIRRKAVGALRSAAAGGASSRVPAPLASPLVEQFAGIGVGRPVPALAGLSIGSQALFHGRAVTSPNTTPFLTTTPQQEAFTASASTPTFADFGAQLAQRAMNRRSAQLAAENPTPPLSQPINHGLGMYQQC